MSAPLLTCLFCVLLCFVWRLWPKYKSRLYVTQESAYGQSVPLVRNSRSVRVVSKGACVNRRGLRQTASLPNISISLQISPGHKIVSTEYTPRGGQVHSENICWFTGKPGTVECLRELGTTAASKVLLLIFALCYVYPTNKVLSVGHIL